MASNTVIKVKDKNKLKNNVVNINKLMINLDKEIEALSKNINALMVGDKTTPYWNGTDAVRFYSLAISNLKHDIEDYVSARNQLETLGRLYEVVNAGYQK